MSFTVYPLDEVSQYFPPEQSSIDQNIQKTYTTTPELKNSSSPCSFRIGLAMGIITLLGSVFAILAAHQVLPTGLNAFNQLHPGSYVIGYGLLTMGFISALISAVKCWQFNKKVELEGWRFPSQPIEYDEYFVKIESIQAKLTDDEMLAVSIKLWGTENDYILTKENDYMLTANWEDFLSSSPSEEEAKTYRELLADKHFVTLENLCQRA